jgi:hypothetical protein
MDRVIDILQRKVDQFEVTKRQHTAQMSVGDDLKVKDVVFYDRELHGQYKQALSVLTAFQQEAESMKNSAEKLEEWYTKDMVTNKSKDDVFDRM